MEETAQHQHTIEPDYPNSFRVRTDDGKIFYFGLPVDGFREVDCHSGNGSFKGSIIVTTLPGLAKGFSAEPAAIQVGSSFFYLRSDCERIFYESEIVTEIY